MKNFGLSALLFFLPVFICLQTASAASERISVELNWHQINALASLQAGFDGEVREWRDSFSVPTYQHKLRGYFNIESLTVVSDTIFSGIGERISDERLIYSLEHVMDQGEWFTLVKFYPFMAIEEKTVRLVFHAILELEEISVPLNNVQKLNKKNKDHSVLASGTWHKLSISKSDIYKVDEGVLKAMGLSPSSIPAGTIKIYGNGGLLLPEPVSASRSDDLSEVPVYLKDLNGNDRLDPGDYVLFYGQGPTNWSYEPTQSDYVHISHPYSDVAIYFLTFGGATSKRPAQVAHQNDQSSLIEISNYDYLIHREFDDMNVLKSGRDWYLEMFRTGNEQRYNEVVPDIDLGQPVRFKARLAARALTTSFLTIGINNNELINRSFFRVSGEYDKDFMTNPEVLQGSFEVNTGNLDLLFRYSKPSLGAYVYMDYYSLRATSKLKWNGATSFFNKAGTDLNGNIKYTIQGAVPMVWDVTDKLNPRWHETEFNGTNASFTVHAMQMVREFVMFSPDQVAAKPNYVGLVNNQDLHALKDIEYLIVSHSSLVEQAERLGRFHAEKEGYTYAVVTPEQVYNEFSSGAQDLTAIRDLARMLYARNNTSSKKFKFVLLMGDASYDYKNRVKSNTNLVPTYQSFNSFQPAYSYSSDDYYAILDDGEGFWGIQQVKEGLDIGIGRIPAVNEAEAKVMVDKIIHYHSPESLGDWRNQVTFLGDDEDNNTHLNDVESVTSFIYNQAPVYNVNKIYLDAFKQEVFGSGQKYPGVNAAIDQSFDRGHLIFNYLGHGGQSGMAHERVITRPQITDWRNLNKLPLFVTATCELSRYDDPAQASPGELALFNAQGGGIGLITTSRLVYIGLNKDLNVAVFNNNLFSKKDGRWQTLGEIYRNAKNNSARAENQRNFILLGDPALTLAYPELDAVITKINATPVSGAADTLRALSSVTVEGEIQEYGVLKSDFSGTAYPSVFDKFLTYRTLGNDEASYPADYLLQNSVLYRGKVSVENGKFSFSFVVPKDIAYQHGYGKLSVYAENGKRDAGGYNKNFYIGGSESVTNIDTLGPKLQLFMEDESFRIGDIVSASPLLLAKVYDLNGINTVGNGIGRDITAILDKGTGQERLYILNDYYYSKLDSYQEGEIRFPFETLPPGKHTLFLKLWDVYNNSASATTEFVIGKNDQLEISSFYSFPNPTSGHGPITLVFNHNRPNESLKAELSITDLTGRIVFQTQKDALDAEVRVEINDGFNGEFASGLYIATLRLIGNDGSMDDKTHKIIIH